jgi:hypothetical protein
METNTPKSVKPKMRARKLKSGVNWQEALKQRHTKQTGVKQVFGYLLRNCPFFTSKSDILHIHSPTLTVHCTTTRIPPCFPTCVLHVPLFQCELYGRRQAIRMNALSTVLRRTTNQANSHERLSKYAALRNVTHAVH